jgi:hypothetical protein
MAAARTATIPAFQMVETGEDNEVAFPVKFFIFDKIGHFDNFIASAWYRR